MPTADDAIREDWRKENRPWIDHVYQYLGAMVHPSNDMPQYGRELGQAVADAALMLNIDFSQLPGKPTKTKLAISYAQLGIDLAGIADNGGGWPANGGQPGGRSITQAFYAPAPDHSLAEVDHPRR